MSPVGRAFLSIPTLIGPGMHDTLIIGRDLSSLIAAVTSVRQGRKTALIMEGDPEMAHQEGGYLFPFDPRPLSGLADQQLVSSFFHNSTSPIADEPIASPMNPAFQVILPGHRVDLFSNQKQLIDDLIREFPDQKQEINRFYRAVAKAGRLIERRLGEDADGGPFNGKMFLRRLARFPAELAARSSLVLPRGGKKAMAFRRIIQAQLKFLSHLNMDDDQLPLSAAYLLSLPSRGLVYPHGGVNAWMSRLRLAFTDHGGILCEGCSVIRMETKPEVAVDLEMAGSSSTLRGKKLIVSAQWEKRDLLLPVRKKFFRRFRCFDSIQPTGYPFYLHMGVRAEGLPEKMAAYAVVVRDGDGVVRDRDIVFLETSLPGETERAPEGRRAITATVFLADSPLRLNDQELKDAATNIIDSLEGFLPFLRENIDYLHVDKSISVSRRYQEIANRKYRTPKRPFWGMTTLSPGTGIPNVLMTGAILRAGLGFEGEIIAGIDAAMRAGREVQHHA
jgi:phytoene dehydrogenase-like protein